MSLFKKVAGIAAVVVVTAALSSPANATVVVNFDDVVTGNTPASANSPWLVATITDTIVNGVKIGVRITFSTSLADGEKLSEVYFMLAGTSPYTGFGDDPQILFSYPDKGNSDITGATCGNGGDPASTGPWDLCLSFGEARPYDVNTSGVYVDIGGLYESDFEGLTGLVATAHVLGIEPNCSGWIGSYADDGAKTDNGSGACGSTQVPEPGSLGLLGLGLAGLGLGFGHRRR